MADYIYMMESRLTPEQQKAVAVAQEITRAHGMNLYLTGGATRDLISGFPIRDLDFTVEGNPLKLQKDLEKAGIETAGSDERCNELLVRFPGKARGSIAMARSESYGKTGKPPEIAPAGIVEDLRRRDFTVNAMGLSLNPGSRGLLLDPTNGVADVEAKVLRILHNYSFLEDPSRLIRATHLAARFHWTLEERTQARYNAALEGEYIRHVIDRALGQEIEQLAYEEEPLAIMRALEKEGWLKALNPRWTTAKVDAAGLGQLMKSRQQLMEMGYAPAIAPGVLHFLTARLGASDVNEMQKLIPRKLLVKEWQNLESDVKALAQRLNGKEAATPSRAWQLLEQVRPETMAYLLTLSRNQSALQKIRNYLGKWRQVKQRFPLAEMAEQRITSEHPQYQQLTRQMFMLMLDGKLRTASEINKFLKPYAPPPPPPPPPAKRARAAKKGEESKPQAGAQAKAKTKGAGKAKPAEAAAAPPKHGQSLREAGTPAGKREVPAATEKPRKAAEKPRKPQTKSASKPKHVAKVHPRKNSQKRKRR